MVQGIRRFPVAIDAAGASDAAHEVLINDTAGKAADVGLYTWGASAALADQLHHLAGDLFADRQAFASGAALVLELGAGTGLVGLAAGLFAPVQTVLSDLSPVLDNLAVNVALNAPALRERGASAAVAALDWAEPATLTFHPTSPPPRSKGEAAALALKPRGARVLFAADVLYSEELPALLVGAVLVWAERGAGARVVFAYPLRVFMLDIVRDLWARMEAAGFVVVCEGRAETAEEFDDERCQEWCVWRWGEEALAADAEAKREGAEVGG